LVKTYGHESEINPWTRLFFKHGIEWMIIPIFVVNVLCVYAATWILSLFIGPLPIIAALVFISILFFIDMMNDILNYRKAKEYGNLDGPISSLTVEDREENFEEWRQKMLEEGKRSGYEKN
jgi:hypothetical protein